MSENNQGLLDAQHAHWQITFASQPEMFGVEPSHAARQAAALFRQEGRKKILELGSGQGRDTVFFLQSGFEVFALDYSEPGLEELRRKAAQLGLSHALQTLWHDVRQRLPFEANAFDGCFSHMLYCMALTTVELDTLSQEIRRVLKPEGPNVYTARNTEDAQYARCLDRGEDLRELDGGFIVHFFSREKVERLAQGYTLSSVEAFEEGGHPRRLWLVIQRKKN
jgi:SAM-dependent methyltransferase